MKVLLINGSPNQKGCTYTALEQVAAGLALGGASSSFFQLGKKPVYGCIGCGKCAKTQRCVFDDAANRCIEELLLADAVVVGSPVYYAGPNGALCAMLDRVFYAAGGLLAGKPAAAVVSCRRAGSTAALDRLNKYFGISGMPVASSQYWNMVHGQTPEEVRQDKEGLQIMRALGNNMAWLLAAAQKQGPMPPLGEEKVRTNFIR